MLVKGPRGGPPEDRRCRCSEGFVLRDAAGGAVDQVVEDCFPSSGLSPRTSQGLDRGEPAPLVLR